MYEYKNGNKTAVVVLHEIYGVNNFIKDMCIKLHKEKVDVFCPSLLKDKWFSYSDSDAAYKYFMDEIGFEVYKKIQNLIKELKNNYEKVIIIGFSVGATIAWRCCETTLCDGIICCYGSRIRDYLQMNPCCNVLLLFAEYDSFDVNSVVVQLKEKKNVKIVKFKAKHGFLDKYNCNYDLEKYNIASNYINQYLCSRKR